MPNKKQKERRKADRLDRKRQREFERREKIREYGTSKISDAILLKREGELGKTEESFLSSLSTDQPLDLTFKQESWLSRLMLKYGFQLMSNRKGGLTLVDRGLSKKARKEAQLLYLINCDQAGAIKIGIALEPKARLRDLQIGSPLPLNLEKVYSVNNKAAKVESMLHKKFSKRKIQGEWFKGVSASEVERALEAMKIEFENMNTS